MSGNRLTPKQRADIIDLSMAGNAQAEIAKHLGITASSVHYILRGPTADRAEKNRQARHRREAAQNKTIAEVEAQPVKRPLPVIESDWIKPPTRAQLMAGR
jgi:predicted transcriptional regulator